MKITILSRTLLFYVLVDWYIYIYLCNNFIYIHIYMGIICTCNLKGCNILIQSQPWIKESLAVWKDTTLVADLFWGTFE